MQSERKKRGATWRGLASVWRKRRGDIICYAAVIAVLIAVAIAAEGYRGNAARQGARIDSQDQTGQIVSAGQNGAPAQSVAEDAAGEEETLSLRLPDGAEVLRPYSGVPAYDGELCRWETHSGTDVRYADGVAAALCGGTVESVSQDAAFGCTVDVRTGGGLLRYMGVEDALVQAGDRLDAGDPVARQSDRVRTEARLGAHVHIEAIVGSACVDPMLPPS